MHQTAFLLSALAAARALGVPTYGGSSPSPQQAQWLPLSHSYSSGPYKQAIYRSFDGLHQFDLTNYIAKYPNSTWDTIINTAVVYSNARASSPPTASLLPRLCSPAPGLAIPVTSGRTSGTAHCIPGTRIVRDPWEQSTIGRRRMT